MTHPEASSASGTAATAKVDHHAALVTDSDQELNLQQPLLVWIELLPIYLVTSPARCTTISQNGEQTLREDLGKLSTYVPPVATSSWSTEGTNHPMGCCPATEKSNEALLVPGSKYPAKFEMQRL